VVWSFLIVDMRQTYIITKPATPNQTKPQTTTNISNPSTNSPRCSI